MSVADDIAKSRVPAFEIRKEDDTVIQVFANGSVKGISGAYTILNRIPLLLLRGGSENVSTGLDEALRDELENAPKSIMREG